jgi:hypothetical protein
LFELISTADWELSYPIKVTYKGHLQNKQYTSQSVRRQATGWTVGVRFPAKAGGDSELRIVETGTGAHTAYSLMGTEGCLAGGKATGA